MAENGCIIFAKNVATMSSFYQSVLSMNLIEAESAHHVLSNGTVELVIHGIPTNIADNITISSPPDRRATTPIKPVFIVESISNLRSLCQQASGGLNSVNDIRTIRGAKVLDGWDPEGNVLQFKELLI